MTTLFPQVPLRHLYTRPAVLLLSSVHVSRSFRRSTEAASIRQMAAGGSMSSGVNGLTHGSSKLHHTVTALNRWSVANRQLPRKKNTLLTDVVEANQLITAVGKIKALHVYDFDNTRRFSIKFVSACYLLKISLQQSTSQS